jgi:hypothetical protein
MTAILASLTRSMRALMLGQDPPGTIEALRAACLASASAPHRALVDATDAMRRFFEQLSEAVFTGRRYSDIVAPSENAKMNADVRALWDGACLYEPSE